RRDQIVAREHVLVIVLRRDAVARMIAVAPDLYSVHRARFRFARLVTPRPAPAWLLSDAEFAAVLDDDVRSRFELRTERYALLFAMLELSPTYGVGVARDPVRDRITARILARRERVRCLAWPRPQDLAQALDCPTTEVLDVLTFAQRTGPRPLADLCATAMAWLHLQRSDVAQARAALALVTQDRSMVSKHEWLRHQLLALLLDVAEGSSARASLPPDIDSDWLAEVHMSLAELQCERYPATSSLRIALGEGFERLGPYKWRLAASLRRLPTTLIDLVVSADENVRINLLGYAQAVQKLYLSGDYKSRTDYPLAFSVRRARFGFGATFFKDHTLFVEYDGAPTTSTVAGKENGFGLAAAHTTHRLLDERLQLRMGKFVVPFSAENFRSSRSYDTVERYMVVNAMFGLPALDTQYGVMLMGKVFEDRSLAWYLAAVNGNGKTGANAAENNSAKEYTLRVTYDFHNDRALREQFTIGAAYDIDDVSEATLTLSDLAGSPYNSVNISGYRKGYVVDFYLMRGALSLRSEFMNMKWSSAAGEPGLSGGFVQAGYFLNGDENAGFQALLRTELARIEGNLNTPKADRLTAVLAGWQWFLNANVRHQMNLITTFPTAAAREPTRTSRDPRGFERNADHVLKRSFQAG
ncbi:MAG: hypothetical protein HC902_06965, partial [Calothrix sp. SM1_5_4]|nr:hypothetical protein [Calothrix sp. SM1_5_4]